MAKLFEKIVIEQQLKNQTAAVRNELKNTFEKKRHLFEEKLQTYQPDAGELVIESQSSINTGVISELRWIGDHIGRAIDTSYQVANGNTRAFADVLLDDGTVIIRHAPATALLELEKRVQEILDLVKAVPTLDPAKGFEPDRDKGKGIYKAREVTEIKTKKTQIPLVKYEATEHHPAQVDVVSADVRTGIIRKQEWSSMITPADKGDMIDRVEQLLRAVKTALHRANDLVLDEEPQIAKQIFDWVIDGRKPTA